MSSNKPEFQGLAEEARICASCGSCRSVCPVYTELGWESAAPRGRIALAKKIFVDNAQDALSAEYVNRAFQCTLCSNCRDACPTRIDTRELWLELRRAIASRGKSPEVFVKLLENIHRNKNITAGSNASRLDWTEDLDDPEIITPQESAEAGYFVGCVASFYPMVGEIPLSFVRIMAKAKVKLTTLGTDEWCCGFPLLGAGSPEATVALAQHNENRIKELGLKTLVTGCPSCYHTWQHYYPQALGRPLEFQVFHATRFLAGLIREGRLDWSDFEELDEVVTYHDPCDLGRNSGIYDPPREVIRSIPGVTLVEMEHNREAALCCGGGGNVQAVDPALTAAIADRRIREAVGTGASILVSACQQCVQVLTEAARRSKARLRVMDISQLLWLGWE